MKNLSPILYFPAYNALFAWTLEERYINILLYKSFLINVLIFFFRFLYAVADPKLSHGGDGGLRLFEKFFSLRGPNYFFYPFLKIKFTFFYISIGGGACTPQPPWIHHCSCIRHFYFWSIFEDYTQQAYPNLQSSHLRRADPSILLQFNIQICFGAVARPKLRAEGIHS